MLSKLYDVPEPKRMTEPTDLNLLLKPRKDLLPFYKQEFSSEEFEQGIMKANLLKWQRRNCNKFATDMDLSELCLDEGMIGRVETSTVKQWRCKEWYTQQAGFITASKAKRIFTLQTSMDKDLPRNVSKLVEEILNPKCPSSTSLPVHPQTSRHWDLKHKDSARRAYERVESKKHHKLRLIDKGFLISTQKPFIGASLDNICTCDCAESCPDIEVEFKCHWKHRHLSPKESFLTPEIGGQKVRNDFSLKRQTLYYFQVQIQMFVAGLTLCDFVVWTTQGLFSVAVPYDTSFIATYLRNIAKILDGPCVTTNVARVTS